MFQNETLFITVGTASFGNHVLTRLLNTEEFDEILIFRRDEKKQDDLRKRVNNNKVKFYLGDVRIKLSILYKKFKNEKLITK